MSTEDSLSGSAYLLKELSVTPAIYHDDKEKPYWKCDYSRINIVHAFTLPEAILKGRAAKDGTARQRGRFFDVNCAFAWLKERKARIPEELYKSCVAYMAEQVSAAGHQETLMPAPPAKWLEANGGNKSEQEWLAAYKGVSLAVRHITASEDEALRRVAMEDRRRQREKAAAEKAAAKASEAAAAPVPMDADSTVADAERASAVPIQELVAAKKVAAKLKKSASSSSDIAAPLSAEKEKKAAAPKKKRSAKEAASSDAGEGEAKVAKAPRKKVVKEQGEAAQAVVAPAKAPKAPKKEVATQLPKKKQVVHMTVRGKKHSGEVADVYSTFTKAFVASAQHFEAPEYAAIVTMNKAGDLTMRPLLGSANVTVPGMHMANCEF